MFRIVWVLKDGRKVVSTERFATVEEAMTFDNIESTQMEYIDVNESYIINDNGERVTA